jgi:hypothetical protein
VLDGEVISRAKLRVDVRKAHLRAYRPERWAEQSTINLHSSDDDPNNLSQAELERRIAELDDKEFTLKESKAA